MATSENPGIKACDRLKRPYVYAAIFTLLLTAAFAFTLLDAFVIPKAMQPVPQNDTQQPTLISELMAEADDGVFLPDNAGDIEEYTEPEIKAPPAATDTLYVTDALYENDAPQQPSVLEQAPETDGVFLPDNTEDITKTDNLTEQDTDPESRAAAAVIIGSYKDENIEITVEKIRAYETDVYIADIRLGGIEHLKTAFARNTYGRNINEKTSVIAGRKAAILAINGDFYGFRTGGWVLRNGVLYRTGRNDTALLMDIAGNLSIDGNRASIAKRAPELRQIWSFGPPLVVDGGISVSENQEISGRSSISNPRTAIGQIGDLHYIFIVSDGRMASSAGLSLYKLAALFRERGCVIAYNLDGGGSAAMYFNGRIVNRPTTDGKKIIEREVSDIVYIGY